MQKYYCCIDLKSYFASVECVERGLDPFKDNLVVADPERSKGTVALAISPALKSQGVKNRCRVYEIPSNLEYLITKPRMKLYMDKSSEIYSIYLRYISPEDIHVYSVDECFFDLTDYLKLYDKTPKELAKLLIDEVYKKTGIRATVGIGTNMFLAKVALDITAKNAKDFMGYLDEKIFKETIWRHTPITDIWNVGTGIAKRLKKFGIVDLYGVAHFNEDVLYNEFGINAELLIDHANGIEPCTMKDIHSYKVRSSSISNGQILFNDYTFEQALVVLKEMVYSLVLELNEKHLVTDSISLYVNYSDRSDKGDGCTEKLPTYLSSCKKITENFIRLYNKVIDKDKKIRKLNVGLNNLHDEYFKSTDLFSDEKEEKREEDLQNTVIDIKDKFGKNALLKGTNFEDFATARDRNNMIGGHNSGEN